MGEGKSRAAGTGITGSCAGSVSPSTFAPLPRHSLFAQVANSVVGGSRLLLDEAASRRDGGDDNNQMRCPRMRSKDGRYI